MKKVTKPSNSIDTFVSRIDYNGPVSRLGTRCWVWQGGLDPDGYGRFNTMDMNYRAHRYAYQAWRGPLIKGLVVMHECDFPTCVNPDHLEQGTQQKNNADAIARGRKKSFKGVNNPNVKLTEYQVTKIRQLHAAGFSKHDLSLTFNVSRRQIYNIVDRINWDGVE